MKDYNMDGIKERSTNKKDKISKQAKRAADWSKASKFERFCAYSFVLSVVLSAIFIFTPARREFFAMLFLFWMVVCVITIFKVKKISSRLAAFIGALFFFIFIGLVAPPAQNLEVSDMPNVVGQKANQANKTLKDIGLKVSIKSDNGKKVIIKSNWTVKFQSPKADEQISADQTVELIVHKPDDEKSEDKKEENKNEDKKPETTIKEITEESEIPFSTERRDDGSIAKDTEKTVQEGKNGIKITTYKVTYDAKGKETEREKIKEETKAEPVNKIVAVGTYVAPSPPPAQANATPPLSSPQPATQQSFANCTELNKVYPHGVGRSGAVDKVSTGGAPVTNYTVDDALYYSLNGNFDRDKDGIACEA